MKKLLIGMCFTFSLAAIADIDTASDIVVTPSAARVEISRTCFNELAKLGCGHPKDDLEHFRSCMNQVFSSLDNDCQSLMKRLYGK